MSEPAHTSSRGLFDSATRLVSSLIAVAQTRLELLSVDLQEARQHLLSLLVLSLVALFAVLMGAVLATVALVMAYWDTHRVLVMALLAVGYFALGGVIALIAMRVAQRAPPVFASSIAELSTDRQHVEPNG